MQLKSFSKTAAGRFSLKGLAPGTFNTRIGCIPKRPVDETVRYSLILCARNTFESQPATSRAEPYTPYIGQERSSRTTPLRFELRASRPPRQSTFANRGDRASGTQAIHWHSRVYLEGRRRGAYGSQRFFAEQPLGNSAYCP